jgi:hypothetical protein
MGGPPTEHESQLLDGCLSFSIAQRAGRAEPILSELLVRNGVLLSAVGESVNPLVFSRFMLMKSTDLENDEDCYSPRDWLIRGFEPEPVFMLIRDPWHWTLNDDFAD